MSAVEDEQHRLRAAVHLVWFSVVELHWQTPHEVEGQRLELYEAWLQEWGPVSAADDVVVEQNSEETDVMHVVAEQKSEEDDAMQGKGKAWE